MVEVPNQHRIKDELRRSVLYRSSKVQFVGVCVFFEYVLISEYHLEIHLWLTRVCYSQVKNDERTLFSKCILNEVY